MGQVAVPVRRAHRGLRADRARLRPRRRDPRAGPDWKEGLSPWTLTERGGRWYGRGIADNKGQHTINMAALAAVLTDARQARLQRQIADRDGRGDRLARLARAVRRDRELLARRRADRLGRPALSAERPTDLPRLPRRLHLRPLDRCARGRAPFGQLGRPALQSRRSSSPMPSPRSSGQPARSAFPNGCRTEFRQRSGARSPTARSTRGAGRPDHRSELGRAGPDAGREGLRLVHLRVLAYEGRQSGDAGQRRPAAGLGALPAALRGRHRPGRVSCRRCAAISTGTASRWCRSRRRATRCSTRPASTRTPLGAWAVASIASDHQQARRSCPISAARCRTTSSPRSWPADRLGAALLPRLLAARAQRAPAAGDRARGPAMMAGLYWDLAEPGVPAKP